MIGGIISLRPVVIPELAGLPAQPSDPFAVLFAALAPVDAALPDVVSPTPDGMVGDEPATEADLSVSAEDLLALMGAAPAPAPAPMLVPAPAEQAVTAPRQTPRRGEVAPAREQPVRAVAPQNSDDAAERLLAGLPMPELNHAQGAPPPLAPPAQSAPCVEGSAAVAPQQLVPSPDEMPGAAMPPMRDASPPPVRELAQHSTGRDPVLAQMPALQTAAPATPNTPVPASPMPVMAQHLAGQIATALPRLRQSGGEAVLTLDPARLGRVTLSWNPGEIGGSVLTVRAVEPATAALLNRLGDDITSMLRAEPAVASAGAGAAPVDLRLDLRLDIGRAERVVEPRQAEMTSMGAQREFAGDAGLSRHQQRAPQHIPDPRAQTFGPAAVIPDDSADAALPRPDRAGVPARLA